MKWLSTRYLRCCCVNQKLLTLFEKEGRRTLLVRRGDLLNKALQTVIAQFRGAKMGRRWTFLTGTELHCH